MCDRKQGPLLVAHGLRHALQLSFRGQGPQVGTGAPREASSALWTLALVLSSRGWRKHGVLGLCSEPGPEPSRGGCGQSFGNDIGYIQTLSLKLFLLNKHRNGYFWHFESSGTGESVYELANRLLDGSLEISIFSIPGSSKTCCRSSHGSGWFRGLTLFSCLCKREP